VPHQITVEELEHGLFLSDRLVAGNDSSNDDIAGLKMPIRKP
jgi:hypothetical protein